MISQSFLVSIWNFGTPKFIYEFMKHIKIILIHSLYEFMYKFTYMNSCTYEFI